MQQPLLLLKTQNHCKLQRFALCFTVCFTVRFTALHSAVRVSLCVSLRFTAPRVFHCSPKSAVAIPISNAIKSSSGPVNLQRVWREQPELGKKSLQTIDYKSSSPTTRHCYEMV